MRYVTARRAADEQVGRLGPWRREDDLVVYRYTVPNDRLGEGWAILTIGSDGTFQAISDWGDYAYWWSHHGCSDIRAFLVRATESPGYFVEKLSAGRTEYDGEATFREIRDYLREIARDESSQKRRKRPDGTPSWLQEERERLRDAKEDILESDHGFDAWCKETQIEEPWEFLVHRPPAQCVAFVERVLAHRRFQNVLRAELGLPLLPVAAAA